MPLILFGQAFVVPAPLPLKFAIVKLPRLDDQVAISAAIDDDARRFAVEVGDAKLIARGMIVTFIL